MTDSKCGVTRRTVLQTLPVAVGTGFALSGCALNDGDPYGPRPRASRPFVNADGQSILVSVSGTDFDAMLAAGMAELGGFAPLVGDGDVLIKPALNHVDPFPGICDPESIASIVRRVAEVTSGPVSVGDMPFDDPSEVYESIDLATHVAEAGGVLLDFADFYAVRREGWDASKRSYAVYSDVYDASVVIAHCRVSRHFIAGFTGAIKSLFGCITGSGGAATRTRIHSRDDFLEEIAEVANVVGPELVIVDARAVLAESGPQISRGRVVDGVDRVVICGDLVAADLYCMELLAEHDATFSTPHEDVTRTIDRAVELGLGVGSLDEVEIREITA